MVAAVGFPLHHHERFEWLSAVRSLGSVSAGVGWAVLAAGGKGKGQSHSPRAKRRTGLTERLLLKTG